MSRPQRDERGQIFVLFALALVAMVGMVGLVLDGGDTYGQRRIEQNASDLAALAGANAYLNTYATTQDVTAATAAAVSTARQAATRNGYTDSSGGASVSVDVTLLTQGASVHVTVSAPHRNNFARVMGMETWTVSTEATAISGGIDTAVAAAPWTMSIGAFNQDGTPKYTTDTDFGETNGDYPTSATDISWTDYNGNNNVNTNEVHDIITGSNVINATFNFGQYLGQHNQGNHTALYGDVDANLSGKTVPIPVVGPPDPPATTCIDSTGQPTSYTDGCFKGWVLFHVTSASGGSDKHIRGYFLADGFQRFPLTVGECTPQQQANNQCGQIDPNTFGAYTVRLVD